MYKIFITTILSIFEGINNNYYSLPLSMLILFLCYVNSISNGNLLDLHIWDEQLAKSKHKRCLFTIPARDQGLTVPYKVNAQGHSSLLLYYWEKHFTFDRTGEIS